MAAITLEVQIINLKLAVIMWWYLSGVEPPKKGKTKEELLLRDCLDDDSGIDWNELEAETDKKPDKLNSTHWQ